MSESYLTVTRTKALDALRGLAILGMVFSGTIPFDNSLPAWMYHAQVPPPNYKFNPNLAGLTWVDLVFPCFLFALGAAIPLALSRRLDKGESLSKIILGIGKRSFLLFSFAIITEHFRPFEINPQPGSYTWKLALLGYFFLFLMYVQLPKHISKKLQRLVTFLGWTGGILFLTRLKYLQDLKYPTFSLYRSDIILIVLANLALFASLIWLLTRNLPLIRLSILIPLFPLIISFNNQGWNTEFLRNLPLNWLFSFDYLKYLFITLPGTVVGDWLIKWLKSDILERSWKKRDILILIVILLLLIITLLLGLYTRQLGLMLLTLGVLGTIGYFLLKYPKTSTEKLLSRLYGWAIYALVIGLAFEPYQGGIKKDSATFSYYFITTAIAIFLLIIFIILIDLLKSGSYLAILIDNGQNPMLAYVSFGNLLWPILVLTTWQDAMSEWTHNHAFLGLMRGLFYTLLVALLTSLCTRLKLFWKT